MKKKRITGAVLAAAVALSAGLSGLSGCSLVSTTSMADMRNTIAEVNISLAEKATQEDTELFNKYKNAVGTVNITKNQLVSYYMTYGYSYLQQGSSAESVINMLMEGLEENAVVTQYAIMYLLNYRAEHGESDVLNKYNACETYLQKLEYLLTDNSSDDPTADLKIAKYALYRSFNNTLDSYEEQLISEDEDEAGTETRTTPTGVDTETEDFYPAAPAGAEGFKEGDLYYNVYTGYVGNLLADSGAYKDDALEGTSRAHRNMAYNQFMNTLASFGLVDPAKDNLRNVDDIPYMEEEYIAQLESRAVNRYNKLYEESNETRLTDDGKYEYLAERYATDLEEQKSQYQQSSDFSGVIGNMNDTTFILYTPDTEGEGAFGLVYNILLPFDTLQSKRLSELQSKYSDEETGGYSYKYYVERDALLRDIKSYDRRSAWFNGETDYSFKAPSTLEYFGKEEGKTAYLFFENNLTKADRYEPLEKYIGKYPYNGTVHEKDGKYILQPAKLTIDGMLSEFKAYVDYVCGEGTVTFDGYVAGSENTGYYADTKITADNFYTAESASKKPEEREIDYTKYIYAKGSVNVGAASPADYKGNLLNKDSAAYKALAAINELQYAYTTDTGVLTNYLGYSVTLGDSTGYIKEFETASHEAISRGAGSFAVCAGDYGWHLIYVTYVFGNTFEEGNSKGGNEYAPVWDKDHVDAEGTFENLYYEYIKSTDIASITSKRREQIIQSLKSDSTVKTYPERYEDLYGI